MFMLLAEAEYPTAPLDLQMQVGWLVLLCLTLALVWAWSRAESLRRAVFGLEDPRLFALVRIGLGLITIQNFWNLNMHWRMLWSDEGMFTASETRSRIGRTALTGWTEIDGFFDHWALVKFFWGKYSLLFIDSSPSFVIAYLVVLYVVLLLFTLGVRTRVTAVVGMLLINSLYNRNAVYHEGHDTVFRCMWFMILFVRTGEAWSVDNWLRRRREAKLRERLLARAGPQAVPFDWLHWLDRAGHWLYAGLWGWAFCAVVDFPLWSLGLVVASGLTYVTIVGIFEQGQRRAAAKQGTLELPELVRFRLIPGWARYLFIAQLMVLYMTTGLYKTGSVWRNGDALYYALNMDHFYRFEVATQWVSVYLATNVFRVFTWITLYWEKLFPLVAIGLILRWRELHRDTAWYRAMEAVWWRIWLGRVALLGAYLVIYRVAVVAYPWCLELQKDKSPTPPGPGLQTIHIVFALVLPMLVLMWVALGRWPVQLPKLLGKFRLDQSFVRKWVFGRRIWLGIGCLFHGMLIATMNIGMFPVIMLWFYPTFFEAKPFLIAGRWLRDRLRASRSKLVRRLAPAWLDDALSEDPGVLETATQAVRRDPTGPWFLDPWTIVRGAVALVRTRSWDGLLITNASARTRGGRMPDALVLVVILSAAGLASLRGLEADPQGSARGTTNADFVGDARTMQADRTEQRKEIEARKKRLERLGDAGHWWAAAGLGLAAISHLRRRPPSDQVERDKPETEHQVAEPPLLGGTLMRTLVLGFIIYHCGAIGTTFIPRYSVTNAWRNEATKVFGHYVSGTNLGQSWKMFAPNPPRANTFMRTVVIDNDDNPFQVGKDHYSGRPYVFWYNDRERKMHRRMVGKSKWYLRYWTNYHCRDWAINNDGQLPKEVRVFRLKTPIPPPDDLAKIGKPSNPRTRKLQSELVETHTCNPDVLYPELKLRYGWPLSEDDHAKLDAEARQIEVSAEAKRKQWDARKDFGGKGSGRPQVGTVEATIEEND